MENTRFHNISEDQWEELYQDLNNVNGCDLDAEDQTFITDMLARLELHGTSVRVSARQHRHIERMKEQYL